MKQFWKPSYHIFIRTPLPRYRWHHNLRSAQKLFFQTCLNCISLGCSLCTDQCLIEHYDSKMQGKRDIMSDTKWYDFITGTYRNFCFSKQSYYISLARSFNANHFLRKDHYLKIPQKKNICYFLNFVIRKNLKEPLHCIYNFIIIHRSLLRPIKTKPVSF